MDGYNLLWWCILSAANTAVVATVIEHICDKNGKVPGILAAVLYLILISVTLGHKFA